MSPVTRNYLSVIDDYRVGSIKLMVGVRLSLKLKFYIVSEFGHNSLLAGLPALRPRRN